MKKIFVFIFLLLFSTQVWAVKEYAKKFPTDTPLEVYTPNNPPPSGGVTNIATTAPISGGPITSTGTISCNVASASQPGCLSSADWSTFNSKSSISGLTINYLPKATSSTTIGDSIVSQAGGYGFTRSIVIDHTKVPNTDQANFPVLISGIYASLKVVGSGGHVQNSNGYDIVFTSDAAGLNLLSWEVEKYVSTTGEIEAWVKIPTLSHTADTTIYMFYGNSAITAFQSTASAVWSNSFVGVYHLPDGSTLSPNDSTGTYNGTNHSVAATTGIIDGGGSFNGSTQWISSSLPAQNAGATTVSMWINPTSVTGRHVFSGLCDSGGTCTDLYFESNGTDLRVLWGNTFVGTATGAIPSTGANYFIAFTRTGSSGSWTLTFYKNGSSFSSSGVATNPTSGTSFSIGRPGAFDGIYFAGMMDEFRVASVGRSADWLATEYANQNSPSTFYTLGSEISGSYLPNVGVNDSTAGALLGIKTRTTSSTETGLQLKDSAGNSLISTKADGTTTVKILNLTAGSTTLTPLTFSSGALNTSPVVGAEEFLTDKYYGVITTGTARKEITLNDAALTSGIVPAATTNGRLHDNSGGTTETELGYVHNVTSAIQTQINTKAASLTLTALSSNITLAGGNLYLVDTTSARSEALPTPSSGTIIALKDVSFQAGTNAITLTRHASENIEGYAGSLVLNTNGVYVLLEADGTNWYIVGE